MPITPDGPAPFARGDVVFYRPCPAGQERVGALLRVGAGIRGWYVATGRRVAPAAQFEPCDPLLFEDGPGELPPAETAKLNAALHGEAITAGTGPPAMPGLPPFPEISWPQCEDRRKAAILFGMQMAEAEALWKLQARAQQHHQATNPRTPPPEKQDGIATRSQAAASPDTERDPCSPLKRLAQVIVITLAAAALTLALIGGQESARDMVRSSRVATAAATMVVPHRLPGETPAEYLRRVDVKTPAPTPAPPIARP